MKCFAGKRNGEKMQNNKKKKHAKKQTKPLNNTSNINQIPKDWLYLTPQEIGIRHIKEAFEDSEYETELWEEAGVLTVAMPQGEVDIETAETLSQQELDELKEDAAAVFGQEIKTVFFVSFLPEYYEQAKCVMKKITVHTAGFCCGDTKDFSPKV